MTENEYQPLALTVADLAVKPSLTVEEAVRLTGIGERTLRDAIKTGQLRARRVGQRLHYILRPDLDAWLAALPDVARQRPARIVPTQPVRRGAVSDRQ